MDEDKTGTYSFPFAYQQRFFSDHNARAVEHVTPPAMTLLDYFAGQALMVIDPANVKDWDLRAMFGPDRTGIRSEEIAAAMAYRVAEAMIAEKAKREASNDRN